MALHGPLPAQDAVQDWLTRPAIQLVRMNVVVGTGVVVVGLSYDGIPQSAALLAQQQTRRILLGGVLPHVEMEPL